MISNWRGTIRDECVAVSLLHCQKVDSANWTDSIFVEVTGFFVCLFVLFFLTVFIQVTITVMISNQRGTIRDERIAVSLLHCPKVDSANWTDRIFVKFTGVAWRKNGIQNVNPGSENVWNKSFNSDEAVLRGYGFWWGKKKKGHNFFFFWIQTLSLFSYAIKLH